MATVSITVPDPNVPEVLAALGFAMGLVDGNNQPRSATALEAKAFVRRQVRAAVLNYRQSQQADIDRTDPTED